MQTTTYVDREEASKILKVSTRTIDRYVRKYRFKTRKDGRRVFIKRVDVDKIISDHIGQFVEVGEGAFTGARKIEIKEMSLQAKEKDEEKVAKDARDEKVYKELYVEAKKDLRERQDRLEVATYRVGQLEAQLKNMVPLLDYSRKEKEMKELQMAMEHKALEGRTELMKMEKTVRNERVAKWLYLSLAGFLLVVEPILFLVWALS